MDEQWLQGYEGARLRTEIHSALLTVTLNKPPVNALDSIAYNEIQQIFDSIASSSTISAVHLRAENRCFSAGQDRRDAPTQSAAVEPYLRSAARAIVAATLCPVPIIASVHSAAIGAGLILASSADILVIDSTATLSLPERKFGVLSGYAHLHRWLGSAAAGAVLTGEPIPVQLLESHGAILVAHREIGLQGSKIANLVSDTKPHINRAIKQEWMADRSEIAKSYLDEIEQTINLGEMDFSLPMSTD